MAQYYTDFSGYPTGPFPTASDDWSVEYSQGASSIVADPSYVGGKALEIDTNAYSGGGTADYALSWDKVGTPTTVEVVCRFDPANFTARVSLRGSGTATSKSLYYTYYNQAFGSPTLEISKYNGNSFQALGDTTPSNAPISNDMWVRFQADGNTIKSRVWDVTNPEPTTWALTLTDSAHSSGWAGIYVRFGRTYQFDEFGVGTNGDTAPTSSVGPSKPAAPSGLSLTEI